MQLSPSSSLYFFIRVAFSFFKRIKNCDSDKEMQNLRVLMLQLHLSFLWVGWESALGKRFFWRMQMTQIAALNFRESLSRFLPLGVGTYPNEAAAHFFTPSLWYSCTCTSMHLSARCVCILHHRELPAELFILFFSGRLSQKAERTFWSWPHGLFALPVPH
jgi:hypothetical protein